MQLQADGCYAAADSCCCNTTLLDAFLNCMLSLTLGVSQLGRCLYGLYYCAANLMSVAVTNGLCTVGVLRTVRDEHTELYKVKNK